MNNDDLGQSRADLGQSTLNDKELRQQLKLIFTEDKGPSPSFLDSKLDAAMEGVHHYAKAYAESIIGPDKRIGDEIAENRSYTGERMHNAVKAEQRTLNNEKRGKL